MFSQGAKVKKQLPPASPRIEALRKALDDSDWERKSEAHRLALANRNKPRARRWLRDNARMY